MGKPSACPAEGERISAIKSVRRSMPHETTAGVLLILHPTPAVGSHVGVSGNGMDGGPVCGDDEDEPREIEEQELFCNTPYRLTATS
jgi:hypothetical protein